MSYYDWVKTFEILKTSPMDENLIKNLEDKTLDGNDYVLDRFINHAITTINTRLNNSCFNCIDRIISSHIDINTLSIDLINIKKEKQYVLKIVNLPVFSKEVSDVFRKAIDETFNDIYNIVKRNVEYIDIDGKYISTFEKIMLSDMEE